MHQRSTNAVPKASASNVLNPKPNPGKNPGKPKPKPGNPKPNAGKPKPKPGKPKPNGINSPPLIDFRVAHSCPTLYYVGDNFWLL